MHLTQRLMADKPIEVLLTVNFSEPQIESLRQLSPRLKITSQAAVRPEEIPAEIWKRTEVLFTRNVLPPPEAAAGLRWVQFYFTGVDDLLQHPLLTRKDVQFTTMSGASAPHMAEFVVTMLLALGHHLPEVLASQKKAEWFVTGRARFAPRELRGSTVGIIGYGSIGREVARLLQPFGVQILAVKRDVMHPHDDAYILEGLGDPQGRYFTRLYPVEALRSMLPACDFVVVAVPLTGRTRGLIDREAIKAMKTTAYLVDVSRGGVIDEEALIAALQDNRIAGAALDVFNEEPLPPKSPFWKLPNVILSPHISGISSHYKERTLALFMENLKLYLAGGVLHNRIDLEKGY